MRLETDNGNFHIDAICKVQFGRHRYHRYIPQYDISFLRRSNLDCLFIHGFLFAMAITTKKFFCVSFFWWNCVLATRWLHILYLHGVNTITIIWTKASGIRIAWFIYQSVPDVNVSTIASRVLNYTVYR